MRIIHAALLAGAVAVLGIAMGLRAQGPAKPAVRVLSPVGAVYAAIALGGAWIASRVMGRRWAKQVAGGTWPQLSTRGDEELYSAKPDAEVTPDGEIVRWWHLYQTRLIVCCAMVEGAAFLQGVAYFVGGSVYSLVLGWGLAAVLLWQFPSRARIDR
jgi:hypothetical protein